MPRAHQKKIMTKMTTIIIIIMIYRKREGVYSFIIFKCVLFCIMKNQCLISKSMFCLHMYSITHRKIVKQINMDFQYACPVTFKTVQIKSVIFPIKREACFQILLIFTGLGLPLPLLRRYQSDGRRPAVSQDQEVKRISFTPMFYQQIQNVGNNARRVHV